MRSPPIISCHTHGIRRSKVTKVIHVMGSKAAPSLCVALATNGFTCYRAKKSSNTSKVTLYGHGPATRRGKNQQGSTLARQGRSPMALCGETGKVRRLLLQNGLDCCSQVSLSVAVYRVWKPCTDYAEELGKSRGGPALFVQHFRVGRQAILPRFTSSGSARAHTTILSQSCSFEILAVSKSLHFCYPMLGFCPKNRTLRQNPNASAVAERADIMYDVTRFDGGVRVTGVCHLTPDILGGSVPTGPTQTRVPTPPQRAFDAPVLHQHVGRGGGPCWTCAPARGIVDEPPHSSEHLHLLPRPAHALAVGCPRFPSRRADRTRTSE
jgi:hypothetical protein